MSDNEADPEGRNQTCCVMILRIMSGLFSAEDFWFGVFVCARTECTLNDMTSVVCVSRYYVICCNIYVQIIAPYDITYRRLPEMKS